MCKQKTKPRKVWLIQWKKQATETACEREQMLDLTDIDFEVPIMNMFKEPKETFIKEVKEGMMTTNIK